MKWSKVGWLVCCTGCETITFKVSRVTLQLKCDHEPQNFKTFISAFLNPKMFLFFLQTGKVHGK
jgi:hypothetical protein